MQTCVLHWITTTTDAGVAKEDRDSVDGLDRCCQTHDYCYDRAIRAGCSTYIWHIYTYTQNGLSITCDSSKNDICNQTVCNCDKAAVQCFARNTYHSNFKDYDKSKC
ncbi:phospholipase A2-like [Lingula anatina]|uniref:Phospholipase A2 n=1 Tax=Lingula anatina TaxID=7574 RepID=A0A1S3J4P2_LINAN|nr:phospholipase A2-like [Lingula anatina]|eukprot:XP_013404809.1 phospholipase A2-like [Lingula anatina]